jgi:putative transposase
VIDSSKVLVSAIDSLCEEAAKVQRWQIHKIRNVTERLPKAMQEQVAWRMKALVQERKAQHPDAAVSVLQGLEQMFTAATPGVQGALACSLSNTNIIESLHSVVRRHSQRVTNYQNVDMALRWTVACVASRATPNCNCKS